MLRAAACAMASARNEWQEGKGVCRAEGVESQGTGTDFVDYFKFIFGFIFCQV
jgi:hypothetical protein